jgi:hypothetical protein
MRTNAMKAGGVLMAVLLSATAFAQDRTHLPITPPEVPKYTELDARNAKAPEPWSLKAPEGAPNVVIVLDPLQPLRRSRDGRRLGKSKFLSVE